MALFIVEGDDFEVRIHADAPTDKTHLKALFKKLGAKPVELGKGYTAIKHQPHTTPGLYHVEVYRRDNKLFALNQDGTAHDQSHGVTIPKHVLQALKQRFPTWTLPPDGKIASFNPSNTLERTFLQKFAEYGGETDELVLALEVK